MLAYSPASISNRSVGREKPSMWVSCWVIGAQIKGQSHAHRSQQERFLNPLSLIETASSATVACVCLLLLYELECDVSYAASSEASVFIGTSARRVCLLFQSCGGC